jgi:hypothetical protein
LGFGALKHYQFMVQEFAGKGRPVYIRMIRFSNHGGLMNKVDPLVVRHAYATRKLPSKHRLREEREYLEGGDYPLPLKRGWIAGLMADIIRLSRFPHP